MANSFSTQVITDTNKRTVIKFTAQLDANGETANVKVIGSQLRGALSQDTNNAVLVSNPANSALNGVPRVNYNYSIARVYYDVWMPNGYVVINWTGGTPGEACQCGGAFDQNFQDNLGVITNNAVGPTGNISFTTVGAAASTGYTIILELHKGPTQSNTACDFDMGQVAAPSDFNFGKYAIKP